MKIRSLLRLSGICGVVGPVTGIALVLAATVASPTFSWRRNALSDLGVDEPGTALLFNAGVIVAGVLFLLFTPGVAEYVGGTAGRIGVALLAAGGVSLILVGVFTEAYGALHTAVSVGYFILVPLGILTMSLRRSRWSRTMSRLSIATGILALLAISTTGSLLGAAGLRMGFAVPEIIEASILAAWTISMGIWMMREASRRHGP